MSGRELRLLILLALVAIGASIRFRHLERTDSAPTVAARKIAKPNSAEMVLEFGLMRSAEKIPNKLRRCLEYPDPPDSQWDRKVVEAYCNLLSRQAITLDAMNKALDEHHADVLETKFDGYSAQNFVVSQHGFLTWVYKDLFESSSAQVKDAAQKWVEENPQSSYALAARGFQESAAAADARGHAYAKDTPQENFDRMKDLAGRAKSDLQMALDRNPNLIAAYYALIHIARLQRDRSLRKSYVRKWWEVDPADPWIYDAWRAAVDPSWGGTDEQREEVANSAIAHVNENPILALEKAGPSCTKARAYVCERCESKPDFSKALELYAAAARTVPLFCAESAGYVASKAGDLEAAARYYSQAIRFTDSEEALIARVTILTKLKQFDWALDDLAELSRRKPGDPTVLLRQGWIHMATGHPLAAESSYETILASNPDNDEATLGLAALYIWYLSSPNKAEPLLDKLLSREPNSSRAWLFKSAINERNDKGAYREALEHYLKSADRDDPQEQELIRVATKSVAELDKKKSN
jgi:hypothetical protein